MTTKITKVSSAVDMATYLIPEATGVADYLEERDASIRWAGAGAAAVGLEGAASPKSLARLLAGEDPETVGDRIPGVVVSSRKRSVMGFEWSYVPPKSVSALWAVADDETRRQIEAAAAVATDAALGQVESASWTRLRVGGRQVREETEGLISVVVPHTSSRDGDPHLHHHVVVANQVRRRSDGKWCTLDARGLYGALAWSGTVWGMTLRAEMSARLGVEWDPVTDGQPPELVGIPEDLRVRWSQRAAAIAADVEGHPGRGAATLAATRTRRTKDMSETREEKHGRWLVEAMALGYPAGDLVDGATGRGAPPAEPMEPEELARLVADRLDEQLVAWDRIEWLTTAAEQAAGRMTVGELLAVADAELGGDGRWTVSLPDDPAGSCIGGRWTTTLTLARERRVIDRAVRMAQPGRPFIDVWEADAACEAAGLDAEQAKAVWDVTLSGRQFSTLAAPAGTGKTTTMGALAAVLDRYGIKARALAVSQAATDELGDALGVPEENEERRKNITRFLMSSEPPAVPEWWIVDEASMVDSRQWDALLARAEETGTTVVAVGDPAQLGAVGPGGLFRAMVDHPEVPTADLVTVWRMTDEWEKAASLQLRGRDPAAVDAYAEHGRIRDHDALEELLDELAAAHADGQDVLVMAGSNRRVDTLNDAMQARLIGDRDPADELVIRWDDETGSRERTVGVGDRIRTRRNDYERVTTKGAAVVNGATWEVARVIDGGGLWVSSDDRGQVLLPASYLQERDEETGRPFVELAYASTVHSAQGRTVDRAVMVVDAMTEAELLYVGMTRGRATNIAVADFGDEDGHTLFEAALRNPSAEAVAALDLIAEQREAEAAEAAREAARQQAQREQAEQEAAREAAERAAALAQERRWRETRAQTLRELVAGLDDGLAQAEVAAAAVERYGNLFRPHEVIDVYGETQLRRAVDWVRETPAGDRRERIADVALNKFAVFDATDATHGRLGQCYFDAAQATIDEAAAWLSKHGWRWDDNEDGHLALAVGTFGIIEQFAGTMVKTFDKHGRDRAVAAVADLPDGLTKAQETQRIVEDWGGTRYIAAATAALQERHQPPEQETPESPLASRAAITQTPTEAERIATERAQLDELREARKEEAARRRAENTDQWEERKKLKARRWALGTAVVNHDKAEKKLGRLSKLRGAKERAAQRAELTDRIAEVEAHRKTLRQEADTYHTWRSGSSGLWEQGRQFVLYQLDEGLHPDEAHRQIVAQYGITLQTANTLDQWEQVETARRKRAQEPQVQQRKGPTGPGLSL